MGKTVPVGFWFVNFEKKEMSSTMKRADNDTLTWKKPLSMTDAQQETQGGKMPFLRFTKQDLAIDYTTWFRNVFFSNLEWEPATSIKGHPTEEAWISIRVNILGADKGERSMRLDHDPERARNHGAPTTHLHYDEQTRLELESTNLSGCSIIVQRDVIGTFSLEIHDNV